MSLVRLAERQDAAALAALHAAVFPHGAWSEEFWRDSLRQPFDRTVLLGKPARAFALIRLVRDEAEILTIGTTTPHRGDGGQLLHALITAARASGTRSLFLEVSTANKAARALYDRFGFETVGERKGYYEDGSDALVMRCQVTEGDDDGPA